MKKIILITGASEGIGAATALLAATQGFKVCVNYRQNKEAALNVVQEIQKNGGEAFAVQADVSIENDVLRLFERIDQEEGAFTGLVNNAGIIEPQQKFVDMSLERINKVFGINVAGTFLCCREAIKRMSVKTGGRGGSIVNVSSMASQLGSPFEYVDYAASKGAVDSMSIGLSKELAEDGIRVNVVRPGIINTEIHRKAGEPGRAERIRGVIPMKRPGEPEEVAKAILWLLSDESSYSTGTFISVSGGR